MFECMRGVGGEVIYRLSIPIVLVDRDRRASAMLSAIARSNDYQMIGAWCGAKSSHTIHAGVGKIR